MKKILIVLAVVALVLTALTGCRKSGLQNVRGMVKNVEICKDTLKSMSITYNEDGDTMLFSLAEARLQRGVMMPQDSVIVDYIYGKGDSLRALVVTVIPKPSIVVEDGVAPSDTLSVIPLPKKEVKVLLNEKKK